jgi:hypothetical protein
VESNQSKEEFLYVIHDKMDHFKTIIPKLQVKKNGFWSEQLPITFTNMIAHGHGDEAFAQYSNEHWSNNPNFTIGSLLHLFRTLEKELINEYRILFEFQPQNIFLNKSCKEIFVVCWH